MGSTEDRGRSATELRRRMSNPGYSVDRPMRPLRFDGDSRHHVPRGGSARPANRVRKPGSARVRSARPSRVLLFYRRPSDAA